MNEQNKSPESPFERDTVIMKMYMDSAKSFITLSSAALALTVTFSKQILNKEGPIVATGALKMTWAFFLITIGVGLLYQYYAGKYIEVRYAPGGPKFPPWPKIVANHPGFVYGAMLACFYAGAVIFMISALIELG